ncbi:hypothetical protein AVEN_141230-1 [Araneus ventricosus]|uniref:DUF7041 domain-containing protein n=1 Tax=Araneus ventricosus TaxID=182803 RepID=A0A4Y2KQM1_ARAVE|nr:hypothetical protein AVEN_81218-1 [Araneus ventricosus]GBN03623.1 hypothetical protein AVEN_141230-1 [Araneus ventricosus]
MEENCAVKMPPFYFGDPQLWFIMAETTFQLAIPKPITASATKYNYCVAHLSPEAAAIVRDVITCPDKDDPYKQLKEELIKRCGESKSQEIRCLLAGEQLGDRKPTDLLRVMQRRAENHQISDTLLLELFLQQLPKNVQSILLAISPLNAAKAAEIADRIMEVTPPEVSKISSSNSCEKVNNASQSELLEEIKALRKEVASLRRSRSADRRPRNNSRKRADFRFRQRSPSQSNDVCWYHKTFNKNARKCIQPCSFSGNVEGQE